MALKSPINGVHAPMSQTYRAIGLMSGTSMDGVDVAYIETDGEGFVASLGSGDYPYDEAFRGQIQACFGRPETISRPAVCEAEKALTLRHTQAVKAFMASQNLSGSDVDLIGFHGQTLWHNPVARETIQIGDGDLLARETGIDVINDFRTADVKAGGQGAPLLPLYHRALAFAADLPLPVAIQNIGGVSNVTWIGGKDDDEILAFDSGPGNALLNDWVYRYTGQAYDKDGILAAGGRIDKERLATFLDDPYFKIKGPKSLDRDHFQKYMPEGLSLEDGAATLTMMTVQSIAHGLRETGEMAQRIYLCGGGARNPTIRKWLAQATGASIGTVEDLSWNSDALEAEGFAYLAVRSLLNLPLSLPGTTGVPWPMTGGRLHRGR